MMQCANEVIKEAGGRPIKHVAQFHDKSSNSGFKGKEHTYVQVQFVSQEKKFSPN